MSDWAEDDPGTSIYKEDTVEPEKGVEPIVLGDRDSKTGEDEEIRFTGATTPPDGCGAWPQDQGVVDDKPIIRDKS